MAIIATDTADQRVDMSNPFLVQFLHTLIAQPGLFAWTAPLNGSFVQVYGSGLTYTGSGDARDLSGGTIAGVDIDLDPDQTIASVDLAIFNLSGVDASAIDKEVAHTFWNQVLKGKDTFHLGGLDEDIVGLGLNVAFGDDLSIPGVIGQTVSDKGAKDVIHAGDNLFDLSGDVASIIGDLDPFGDDTLVRYVGGKDKIDSGGPAAGATDRQIRMAGDALEVGEGAFLRGGDDKLAYVAFSGLAHVAGDALVQGQARIIGGADQISVDLTAGAPQAHVAGDVLAFTGGGVLDGGDDLIIVKGATAIVGGDVYESAPSAPGVINGGDDHVIGSDFLDFLVGDLASRMSPTITVNGGDDLIEGGAGDDTLIGEVAAGFAPAPGPFTGGDDTLIGGKGNDELFGQSGLDLLSGDDGRDTVQGGDGDDTLLGGESADLLIGELGADRMSGGGGKDTFSFYMTAHSGPANPERDRITDFVHRQDIIDLSPLDAIEGGGAGNDAFTFIGADGFTQAGQIRAVQSGADTLIQMNTMGVGGAEMSILLLDFAAGALTAADFIA